MIMLIVYQDVVTVSVVWNTTLVAQLYTIISWLVDSHIHDIQYVMLKRSLYIR